MGFKKRKPLLCSAIGEKLHPRTESLYASSLQNLPAET
jgi:hypothetical protein